MVSGLDETGATCAPIDGADTNLAITIIDTVAACQNPRRITRYPRESSWSLPRRPASSFMAGTGIRDKLVTNG